MHSHYLVIEAKEDENAENDKYLHVGEKSKMSPLMGSKLNAGIYYVKDPNEKIRFQVTCR
jgi:hypothetical protein